MHLIVSVQVGYMVHILQSQSGMAELTLETPELNASSKLGQSPFPGCYIAKGILLPNFSLTRLAAGISNLVGQEDLGHYQFVQ